MLKTDMACREKLCTYTTASQHISFNLNEITDLVIGNWPPVHRSVSPNPLPSCSSDLFGLLSALADLCEVGNLSLGKLYVWKHLLKKFGISCVCLLLENSQTLHSVLNEQYATHLCKHALCVVVHCIPPCHVCN